MANVERITVERIGTDYNGSVLSGGVWYPITSKAKVNSEKLGPSYFEKGKSYNVEIYVSEKGKKYISGVVESAPPVVSASVKSEDDDRMSKDDWTAKDKRISKQGLIQSFSDSVMKSGYVPTADKEQVKELTLYFSKWAYETIWGEEWK
jgi:hypothetical protein